ncbi:MAG: CotH kinase family protein, partial [Saprospiraceae bacterium]|nr:CotH kinase family protein [Saprospiraceae bacterium]
MKNSILYPVLLFASLLITQASAQVVINEYSCANWRNLLDYYQGTEDWVELYNTGTASVDLSGYHLSDRKGNPTKWTFPPSVSLAPGAWIRIWCSGRNLKDPQGNLHTSFKLTQTRDDAEHIVFADPAWNILEDIEIEKTQTHQSWGRFTDGGQEWRIFIDPSPGTTNAGHTSVIGFVERPDFNRPPGFYQDSVVVTITVDDPTAEIRYTTDGTEPAPTSALYTQPLKFVQTTVLKATAFSANPLLHPSFTQYQTYFINEHHTLAVVSVAGAQLLNLANGNQNLRPLGSIEYFNKQGERKARTYGELNSHGQDSWANDQRSLDWVSRDEMGYNYAVKEQLFPLTERDEFQRIILRASGDDNYPAAHHPQNEGSAHVRDAYIHNLAKRGGLNLDVRTAEKCIVYLNGQYWGVYDMREIPDDHDYTEYYYDQGQYDIQYVLTWGNTWAEYGGTQAISAWNSIRAYILNNDMNDPVKFQYVKDRYDYTSLIDYVIANSFTVCTDWLNYNTGLWRGLNPEGTHQRWGYILWDNDATFDHYINYTGLPSTQADAEPCNPESLTGGSDPQRHIQVLNKLRTNPEVQQYYLSRQADLMYTVFGCENMLNYLDTIEALIDPEMARHAQR